MQCCVRRALKHLAGAHGGCLAHADEGLIRYCVRAQYCFGDCAVVGNAKLNLPRTSSMPALERREEAAEAKDMLTSASQQASEDDGAIGMPGDLNATAGGET
eukprot:scaffold4501_cov395-Prasinococcus_capsulatus_cf.AAC.5